MKLLHLGLCVQPEPFNGFQTAFIKQLGAENYREIATGDELLNVKVFDLFNEFKPDIVFMQIQAPNIISLEICEYMKNKGAIVINWTGDKRAIVPEWMIELAPFVSITSFSNMDDVNTMRELGFKSEYLEIGYDPLIYTPIGGATENVPEIVFMGNNYGAGCFDMSEFRLKMVEFLRAEYGNRFGVYGSGWDNANGNANGSQRDEAALYRGAKIAINCSHFDSLNYNSDRLLRILGSGVCCLSYEHKGMRDTYRSGEDVIYFKDLQQLKKEIDLLFSIGDIEMRAIGYSGYETVKNMFTFEHQVKNIIKLAE